MRQLDWRLQLLPMPTFESAMRFSPSCCGSLKNFKRVGGLSDIRVDVRVVAATNRSLEDDVKAGKFRDDLYYRLQVMPIALPPLRDRKGDALLLAAYFVDRYNREFKKRIRGLSPAALSLVEQYSWPGSIRELRNAIERAMLLTANEWIEPQDLTALTHKATAAQVTTPTDGVSLVSICQLIAQELGIKLENVTLENLGRGSRIVGDREHTTIVAGKGDKQAIAGRCQELRKQIVDTTSDYDREKVEERLAKLSGVVAVIRVGAPSEAEMKSRHEAFDDAIHATRAAVAEGVVPGAGLALQRAVHAVDTEAARLEGDERSGAQILRRALEVPARQIAENSGVDGGVVVDRMRNGTGNLGFDAASGKYVDLVEAGIIDPTKVVRLALENAVSVAGVLLLTEATMTEVPDAKPRTASASADMGM